MLTSLFTRSFTLVIALLVIAAAASWMKVGTFGTQLSGDSVEYVDTAQALCGDGGSVTPHRVLKPLAPLTVCALHQVGMDYHDALLLQSIALYLALAVAVFVFARSFFKDDVLAFFGSLIVTLSYPMMKYGIDIYTETGAIFFVVVGLTATMHFALAPSMRMFLLSATLVSIGFLWKEYSVVVGLTLAAATLAHRDLSFTEKVRYAFLGLALFALIHVPWQIFIHLHYGYSYLMWYMGNATAGFAVEFTIKNIVKSTAAILGVAWLLVPWGIKRFTLLEKWQQYFLLIALPFPFLGYAWGYISSRLLFVLAPPFLLLALQGMRALPRSLQGGLVILIVAANVAWLFLSYRVIL